MSFKRDEYNPNLYIEEYRTAHKIIISCSIKIDELLERGGNGVTGTYMCRNQIEELQKFQTELHNIENEIEDGIVLNLEIKDFKQKFGTNIEDCIEYNIPLSPMTEYPAANLTLRSQVYPTLRNNFNCVVENIFKCSPFSVIGLAAIFKKLHNLSARNIFGQAGEKNGTIPLIAGGACILALSGYCIDNAYTAGIACKAKMEHVLEYKKLLDVKQILETLVYVNRLNKSSLQTALKNECQPSSLELSKE